MESEVKVLVAQSCPTLCVHIDCNPPGSSVHHGILQARILEWVAIPFSRGSSWPRDQTQVSCSADRFFTISAIRGIITHIIYNVYITYTWRRQWHPTPVLSPGKSHGRGAWWATVHGAAKSRTQLSDFTFCFHFHALEEEMATLSSVLAWGIPGMGEPGGLPSLGSHRVGHDWSDLAAAAATYTWYIINIVHIEYILYTYIM